ncbi:hypothetical protein CHK_3202 [Christensenella hongkongensis]|uniref:Uncharacterized protein n=1 Tax=Christensenella hongkongensis TaxID=270498 RepID=A0A0M2NGD5_9FIRM|nr:hypothetical protein CHK_3202 [Christensenella hongkongensis]
MRLLEYFRYCSHFLNPPENYKIIYNPPKNYIQIHFYNAFNPNIKAYKFSCTIIVIFRENAIFCN